MKIEDMELGNTFTQDPGSYDVPLKLTVHLSSSDTFLVEGLTFTIILSEENAASLSGYADVDPFEEYLMSVNDDEHGQQSSIQEQVALPFELTGERKIELSIPIHGLVDTLKDIPGHVLENDEVLDLRVACYINEGSGSEQYHQKVFKVPVPKFN